MQLYTTCSKCCAIHALGSILCQVAAALLGGREAALKHGLDPGGMSAADRLRVEHILVEMTLPRADNAPDPLQPLYELATIDWLHIGWRLR